MHLRRIRVYLSILEKIKSMEDIQRKLQVQTDNLENRFKAMEETYSEIKNYIMSPEIDFKREIYDISKHLFFKIAFLACRTPICGCLIVISSSVRPSLIFYSKDELIYYRKYLSPTETIIPVEFL